MRRRPVLLLAAVLAVTPAQAQQPPPQPGAQDAGVAFFALVSKGQAALDVKDYASAQSLLEEAVSLRPSDAEAHYLLGRAYGQDKKNQKAIEHLGKTLALSPTHALAMIDLASIEENTGLLEEAGAHYRQALAVGPNPRAERGLAVLLAKQGRFDEAIERLRQILAANAGDVDTRHELGMALMQKGDCAAAAIEFRAVIESRPAHLGALFNLGNCLNRTGARDEGARMMERFRKTSEEEEARTDRRRRAYFLMLDADKHFESGDLGAAVTSLQGAVELNPDDARIHAMLGQALDARGDGAGALAAFRRSVELNPSDPYVLIETGRLLGKSGRFVDAIPFLRKAAQVDPEMPEPHMFLAAAYRELGRTAEAVAEEGLYRRLSQRRPGPPVDQKP